MHTAPPDRTGQLLRVSTAIIFVLLGISAYLLAATIDSDAPRAILQSIGSFLVGTVVIGYAYEYFLREDTENRTVAKLDKILAERVDEIFPDSTRYGFRGFATDAPRSSFDDLGEGDELLWLDTYSPDLMLFMPDLRAALERGANIRILAITPEADTAKMRAKEIADVGYDVTRFADGAREFLGVVSTATKGLDEAPGRLEIRCYEDLPCVPMYLRLHAGRPVSGVTGYFLAEPSFNAVHIRWSDAPDGILASFFRYFERKWLQLPCYFDSKIYDFPAPSGAGKG
jgi:hypothetical protein